jgi:phosphate-selective porin OprO and OprP
MSLTKRFCLIAGAALSLSGAAMAQSTLDQSRAYGRDLLSDASGRTNSLTQDAKDFTVNLHGYTLFRYNVNHRDDDGLDSEDNDITLGFQNAITALNVSGNIANENWGYFVQFEFSDATTSGDALLDDAYGTYKMGNGWRWTFGQFKLPLYREELVGDQYQLFANRSVLNSTFTQMRSQGIQLSHEGDAWQFYAAFSDGVRTANTDFTSAAEADWAFTGRANFKWAGDWKQARDFTSFQNSDFFGMVGFAGHYQDGGSTVGTADVTLWDLTADVSIEGNGWNVFAAGIYSNFEPAVGDDVADMGFIVQGGLFLAPQWEIIAGYDMVIPDDDRGTLDGELSTIRVGVNHYVIPESHAVKFTVDFSYFLDAQDESIAPVDTLTGLLASGEDTQWNLRGQIQLAF